MDAFIAWLWDVSYWHWWAFGIVLITIEAFAPSTYLIWPAVSAGVIGVAVAIDPDINWRIQILSFAVLAVASNVAWFFWLKRHPTKSDRPDLNLRTQAYVGRKLTLSEPLADGQGRVRLDDSWWRVRTEDGNPIERDQRIEIVGAEGTTLTVRRLSQSA